MSAGTYNRIYAVVRRIPKGRVATYGQVAELAGYPGHARQVGYALSALPDDADHENIPWHRVINAHGLVSQRSDPTCATNQYQLLSQENIKLDDRGRVELNLYRWRPKNAPR